MNISKILLFSPLFAFSYFLRLGESSFYLFDIWFILFFLFTFRSFGKEDLKKLFIFIFSFVFISLLGLVNGLINYTNNFEIAKYFSGLYRYLQFIYILLFILLKFKNIYFSFKNVYFYLFAVLFVLAYSVFFWYFDPERVVVFDRLAGFFGDPNALGVFIALSIIPVFNSIIILKNKKIKIFLFLAFISFYGFNLLYAGSNSYWIITILSLILFFISNYKLILLKINKIFIGVVIVVFAILFNPVKINNLAEFQGIERTVKFFDVLTSGGDINDLGSGSYRTQLKNDSIDLIWSKPSNLLFGIGLGQSPNYIGKKYGEYVTAHNSHIVLIMELGFLGYLFLLFFCLYLICKINRFVWFNASLFLMYFLSMLAVPHVYLPIFWMNIVYGLLLCKLNVLKNSE